MKMYIPEIGDKLELTKDWTFQLYHEHRNVKLLEHFGITPKLSYGTDLDKDEVTLPKGTVLKVDRIYIRKGGSPFSSVSFWAEGIKGHDKRGARFWAKLNDCNNIEFKIASLKDRGKHGLWWYVKEYKQDDFESPLRGAKYKHSEMTTHLSETGHVYEKGMTMEDGELYRVEITGTRLRELVEKKKIRGLLGGGYTQHVYKVEIPDLEYAVYDKEGNEVGKYGSFSSMQKAVRKHYKES